MVYPGSRLHKQRAIAAIWMIAFGGLLALSVARGGRAGEKVPTYTKDVAPILTRNCVKCHAEGEIAFRAPLTSYEAAQSRAEKIKEKVVAREMPPWPADPRKSVKFRNDARLSENDIDTIVGWVNAGAPKGDEADLAAAPRSEAGWMEMFGRKPDLVLTLPGDFHLQATGELPYVRILVKVPFEDDRWVVASQTRPSNPAVVHHMAVTEVALPEGMRPEDAQQVVAIARQLNIPESQIGPRPAVVTSAKPVLVDMLGIYTPGSTLEKYGEGSAKLLKGGRNMYLNFNMHYETTGKAETDRSEMAFWFQPGPPEHQLYRVNGAGESILANGKELLMDDPGVKAEGTHVAIPPIPAYAENYELIGMTAFAEAVTIYQFQPHAHHRGRDFRYTAVYPDGRGETLLSVPKYDHRWQMAYEPAEPVKLPAGSKLVVTAHYDNSTANLHNHAPEKTVYFRDKNQSWDEMFTPFIQYSIDGEEAAKVTVSTAGHREGEAKASDAQAPKGGMEIAEVVGCLTGNSKGGWQLGDATTPDPSETQATTLVAVRKAATKALGSETYEFLGARMFQPASHEGEKVVVKGMLIRDKSGMRINVTSLQTVGVKCGR